ncbi:MAG: hypothetical protein A4E32_00328 [Methanomassiliicoccales archaeon PtaU1.Bin124]|nr:MAG: hypothetical protein A4E32_00328 [Methanomassiliicoccales archaeon PtaU1.Bin124]
MGELEKTVAIVFKRKGKSMLSEREFINTLLFDLRWSETDKSPKITAVDAQKVLDAAKGAGLLALTEGVLKPNFDYKSIEIPLNYLPSKTVLGGGHPKPEPTPTKVPHIEVTTSTTRPLDPSDAGPEKVPVPPAKKAEDLDVPLFAVLIEEISRETGMGRRDFVARVNKLAERLRVSPEVAALVVAREEGMDISKYFSLAKEEIKKQ